MAELSGGELPQRAVSAAAYELLLSPPGMQSANSQYVSGRLSFFPASASDTSWAIYGVSGFSTEEERTLVNINPAFEGGRLWLGVADFETDAWVWYEAVNAEASVLDKAIDASSPLGHCYIALVSYGATFSVDSLRFVVNKPYYSLGQGFPLNASDGAYDNRITVSWSGPAWAVGYQLYRDSITGIPLATLGLEDSYVDTGVSDRLAHRYWVHALAPSGMGSYSTADAGYLSGEVEPSGWKQYRANARRNGRASNAGPQNPRLLWKKDYRQIFSTEPALSADKSRVAVGCSNERRVYCLDSADLATLWTFKALAEPSGGGAFDPAGNYYFADRLGVVYSLNASGQQNWIFDSGSQIEESIGLAPDGSICFATVEPALYCLEPDGSLRYAYTNLPAASHLSSIKFDSLGQTFYIVELDDTESELVCLDSAGSLQWSQACIGRGLAVFSDGSGVAIAVHEPELPDAVRKLGPDGTEIWSYHELFVFSDLYDGLRNLSLAAYDDGRLFVLLRDDSVAVILDVAGQFDTFLFAGATSGRQEPFFSSSGSVFLTGSANSGLQWDLPLVELVPGSEDPVFRDVLPAACIGRMVEPAPGVLIIPCAPTLYRIDTSSGESSYIGLDDFEGRSPVFDSGGNCYIVVGNMVRSYSPSGFERWSFELPKTDKLPGCVACDRGQVYFPSGSRFYCLDGSSGSLRWDFYNVEPIETGQFAVSPEGDIYLYQSAGGLDNIICLGPDGSLRWVSPSGSGSDPDSFRLRGPICLDGEDNLILPVYFGQTKLSPEGEVLAEGLGVSSGASIAIGPQGFVYGCGKTGVMRIDPDGSIGWLCGLPDLNTNSRPVLSINPQGLPLGFLFDSEHGSGSLVSFGAEGSLTELSSFGSALGSGAAVLDSNGVAYLGLDSGEFVAINPNGSLYWSLDNGFSYCDEMPALAADGRIVFKGAGAVIYCIGD